MQEFLNKEYYGNIVWAYLIAAGIFVAGVIIIHIFKAIVLGQLKKWAARTNTNIDDLILKALEKTVVPLLYLAAFYSAVNTLNLHPKVSKALNIASVILLTVLIIRAIVAVLRFGIYSYLQRKGDVENREKQIRSIIGLGSVIIWALGFIFLLDNLGFKISTVIAGLGIGGIAIALAAQTILGDLFSYFVIFFDKPFQIGDTITLTPDKAGSVEYIGLKTTRIRSISGEQLIVSNTDLVNSRIHNYKRMERRRVVFRIGVVYNTPADKLAEISSLIKEIITAVPDTAFDRAHFFSFGDFSLIYEIVYFVQTDDYNRYMDIQQEINLKISHEFESRKIVFAMPTQTLYLRNADGAQEPKTEILPG